MSSAPSAIVTTVSVAATRPASRATTAAPTSPHEASTAVKNVGAAADSNGGTEEEAVIASTPALEDGPPIVDEAAESAFLAEAKERGEAVPRRKAEDEEEANPKALPPLDELVAKIPADVRETLEDLFRARFVTVKRFPKKALKQ